MDVEMPLKAAIPPRMPMLNQRAGLIISSGQRDSGRESGGVYWDGAGDFTPGIYND